MISRPTTATPATIQLRYFSKNEGSAVARRGRVWPARVERLRGRVGVGADAAAGVSVVSDDPSVCGDSRSVSYVGVAPASGVVLGVEPVVGRDVAGRRERLATDWSSPVERRMARRARGRRAQA